MSASLPLSRPEGSSQIPTRALKGLYNAIFFATVCISRIMDESRMPGTYVVVRLVPHGGLCAFRRAAAKPLSCGKIPSGKTDSGSRQEPKERSGERNASREHGGTQAETEARARSICRWDEVLGQLTAHCTVYKTITLTQSEAQVARQSGCDASTARRSTPQRPSRRNRPLWKIRPGSNASAAGSMRTRTGTWGGIWTKNLYFLATQIYRCLSLP